MILRCRDERGNKFFDALQEKSSRDDYGSLLGRLVCFHLRIVMGQEESESDSESELESDEESSDWSRLYPLRSIQKTKLRSLGNILRAEEKSEEEVDEIFHEVVKELFCWQESRKLLDEMACPVQRFLVAVCLRKEGKGFVNVRDITPLIAKLWYCIRGTVYMEFLKRKRGRSGG